MPTMRIALTANDRDALEAASALAILLNERDTIDTVRKATASEFRGRLAILSDRIRAKGEEVRGRIAWRDVEYEEIRNPVTMTIDRVAVATGELLSSRPMRADERQEVLPGITPPPAPASAPAPAPIEEIAAAPPPLTLSEGVLSPEERAQVRAQFEEQDRYRRQRAEVDAAFAPAPPPARRARRAAPEPDDAPEPEVDPVTRRFQLLEFDDVAAAGIAKDVVDRALGGLALHDGVVVMDDHAEAP